jgi:peptide/nickel transport system permease protein
MGAVAGFFGGAIDNALMRFTDAIMSVPVFFLLLAVVSFLGSSALNVILALGMTRWMGVARLVRGEMLRYKEMDFVVAAHAAGSDPWRIIIRHLLPQAVPSISVATTLSTASAILSESALSYLGLGVQPPTPTWGNMLSYSQNYLWVAPQLAIYPGLLILFTILAFNFLGDGLREALDPFRRRT